MAINHDLVYNQAYRVSYNIHATYQSFIMLDDLFKLTVKKAFQHFFELII